MATINASISNRLLISPSTIAKSNSCFIVQQFPFNVALNRIQIGTISNTLTVSLELLKIVDGIFETLYTMSEGYDAICSHELNANFCWRDSFDTELTSIQGPNIPLTFATTISAYIPTAYRYKNYGLTPTIMSVQNSFNLLITIPFPFTIAISAPNDDSDIQLTFSASIQAETDRCLP